MRVRKEPRMSSRFRTTEPRNCHATSVPIPLSRVGAGCEWRVDRDELFVPIVFLVCVHCLVIVHVILQTRHRTITLTDPVPLGRQILAAAGSDPVEDSSFFAILPSVDFETFVSTNPLTCRS